MNLQSLPATRGTAWLDLAQGASGLVLVLFMWVHMFLVSSILLGKDAMYTVTRALEGEFIFGQPYPILVSAVASAVLAIFLLHALVAMWKLPGSYREYRVFWRHRRGLAHSDTTPVAGTGDHRPGADVHGHHPPL